MWTYLQTLLSKLIRTDQPESPQLVVVLSASTALILTLAAVVVACAFWIALHGDLGAGAAAALGLAIGGLTALAIHSNTVGASVPTAPGAGPGADGGNHV